jgi:hypothetical protein
VGSPRRLAGSEQHTEEQIEKQRQRLAILRPRLAGITTIEAANVWLKAYIAEHNARFAVKPEQEGTMFVTDRDGKRLTIDWRAGGNGKRPPPRRSAGDSRLRRRLRALSHRVGR